MVKIFGIEISRTPKKETKAPVKPQPAEVAPAAPVAPETPAPDTTPLVKQYIQENYATEAEVGAALENLRKKLPELMPDDTKRAQELDAMLAKVEASLRVPTNIISDMKAFNGQAKRSVDDLEKIITSSLNGELAKEENFDSIEEYIKMYTEALCENRRSNNPKEVMLGQSRLIVIQYTAQLAISLDQMTAFEKDHRWYGEQLEKIMKNGYPAPGTPAANSFKTFNELATDAAQRIQMEGETVGNLRSQIRMSKDRIRVNEAEIKRGDSPENKETIAAVQRQLEAAYEEAFEARTAALKKAEEDRARRQAAQIRRQEALDNVVAAVNTEEWAAAQVHVDAMNEEKAKQAQAEAEAQTEEDAPAAQTENEAMADPQ